MAIPSTSLHARSTSLPSLSHPLGARIEEHLRRLRSSQAGPSSSSSVYHSLGDIKDLYEQMNDFMSLPHCQKDLCRDDIEELLEGSLALLDASRSALNVVSHMKESVLDLQSSLRRGNGHEGISTYLASRKKISKIVSKSLPNLKKAEKNFSCSEKDAITMKMLQEAEAVSLSMLKSVLLMFKPVSRTLNLSMVAKLVKSKNFSSESEIINEADELDRSLRSLAEKQLGAETKALMKQSETVESIIHELEVGLELLSRFLVKTRVSLLNLLHH